MRRCPACAVTSLSASPVQHTAVRAIHTVMCADGAICSLKPRNNPYSLILKTNGLQCVLQAIIYWEECYGDISLLCWFCIDIGTGLYLCQNTEGNSLNSKTVIELFTKGVKLALDIILAVSRIKNR